MTARLLIGTSGVHTISEDPALSTATSGATTVKLHSVGPVIAINTDRASYQFSVTVTIQADTVANKKTARDLVLAQLNREYEDVILEQTSGDERITIKTSTGEAFQWVAKVVEEDGHLATAMQITFTARTRIASGGGGTDPILNPPGLFGEIQWDFFQDIQSTPTWTIKAVFLGDGTDEAYKLANEWVAALDATRPAFLKDTYQRAERFAGLNGLTGTTTVRLVYAIPTRVKEASGDPVALPSEVSFAEYASRVEPYLQVDSRLTDSPLQFTIAGYVTIKIDSDQTFDPDDPDAAAETDTVAKVAAVVETFINRALEVYGLTGLDAVDLRIDYGRADAGGRSTFQVIKLFGTNGYIAADEEVLETSEDTFSAFPADKGGDWVYRPNNSLRVAATQVITWNSEGQKPAPFGKLSGLTLRTETPMKPKGVTLMIMDLSTGQMTDSIEVFAHRVSRTYVKINEGDGGSDIGHAPAQVADGTEAP